MPWVGVKVWVGAVEVGVKVASVWVKVGVAVTVRVWVAAETWAEARSVKVLNSKAPR